MISVGKKGNAGP